MRLHPLAGRHAVLTMTSMTCLATAVACGGGGSPEISGLTDTVAQVGTELKIDLNGTDPDGDQLIYGFRAADLPEVSDLAQVTVSPSGAGVFRWTPLASDVGEHSFDFTVSDGSNTTTDTITIDVKSAIGNATAPLFRQPLGTGTTIDLAKRKCVDLAIVVEDQDNAQTTITQEEPVIDGATLSQNDGLMASWQWCPSKEQEAESRYTLVLAADDGENPKTIKNYLVVLRGGSEPNCPGNAPVITHTPQNASTIIDLTIDARVTDDKGLKESPLFYYSTTQPANPPILSDMIQLSMLKIDGSSTDATYAADVPNPVAGTPAGTSKTLFYVLVADDDDDETGNCDHSTTSQVFEMTVTSNGAANLPVCASCTSDSQCGTGDLCAFIGSEGASFCLQSCATGCPTGYACSNGPVFSVDGASANQCVPQSGSCAAPTGACLDDANEEDDSRSAASANATANGPLAPGFYDFVSCPKAVQPNSGSKSDDDWFQIKVDADSKLDLWLYGNGESDLDLTLYRSNETVLSKSTSLTADENIVKCLTPGTYYVKVNGYDAIRSEYLLDYASTPEACNTTCTDDAREDDDTYSQARPTTSPFHTSTGNVTCPNDDDWYKVTLVDGDKITIDLTFTQSDSTQDIDLHLYKNEFTDLWPCSVTSPSTCTSAHGQGASSNEHATETITTGCAAGCDYFVVVRGYNGSTNNYDIAIKVE
ncbi:MAG: leucine aminopeptidase-related protein [Deltaproteobacteria bacterium]|nr:leucine aminopeptidase-related protein [Deltaproteobacteria bacterium]